MRRLILGILYVVLSLGPGMAQANDTVDGLLEKLRANPNMTLGTEQINATIRAGQKRPLQKYSDALTDLYVEQVKWSLLSPEEHGGWPIRSSLIRAEGATIYKVLRQRVKATPKPILAYALLCPALQQKDETTVQECLLIAAKDPYLKTILKERMEQFRASGITG